MAWPGSIAVHISLGRAPTTLREGPWPSRLPCTMLPSDVQLGVTPATARHGALQLPNHCRRPSSRVGSKLHARCMQLSITAGGLLEYCTALCVGYLPMRLTSLHSARSCRGKEGKERKRKTASLGSQVPQPISAVAICFHQHSRPSSNILTLCPFRRSPSSELSLTSADRPISLATRGYGVTTRGRSD